MAKKITKKEKDVSLNDLARMVAKGFANAEENLQEFRNEFTDFKKETNLALFSLDSKVHSMDENIKKINKTLEPLYTGYQIMQNEIKSLNDRMLRVEKKAGITK